MIPENPQLFKQIGWLNGSLNDRFLVVRNDSLMNTSYINAT